MISSTASHAGLIDWSAMAAYQKAVREYLAGVSSDGSPTNTATQVQPVGSPGAAFGPATKLDISAAARKKAHFPEPPIAPICPTTPW